jgi:hypothetical protein
MNNSKTRYQIKNSGTDKWVEVSEKTIMEMLADRFDPLTPVLSQILTGREIITPHATYRKID